MKTYKEFITELNKVEAMMKAGKLAVKTIQRLAPKNLEELAALIAFPFS